MNPIWCQGRFSRFAPQGRNDPHWATGWVDAPYMDRAEEYSGWYCSYHAMWVRWLEKTQPERDQHMLKLLEGRQNG